MRYVFDIDGTVCTRTFGDYEHAEPYVERIEHVNSLYDEGHEIVFMTARGMGRHKGNAELARRDLYDFTHKQLIKWGAKFHSLVLGKPDGDLFVDDKGIHCDRFFGDEKNS